MAGESPSQRRGSSSPTNQQICRRIERAKLKEKLRRDVRDLSDEEDVSGDGWLPG